MRKIIKCMICFLLTLGSLTILLTAVSFIPQSAIAPQMQETAEELAASDNYHYNVPEGEYSVQDNYADSILMGIIWDMDAQHPFTSVVRDSFYSEGGYANLELEQAVSGKLSGNVEYSRYWHGSMILLRPLLTVFNLAEIRIVMAVLLGILVLAVAVLLIRRKCLDVFIIYLIGLLSVNVWFVPLCMEYISNFLIMNLMIIAFLVLGTTQERCLKLSIIAGTATAFCDFLTTETITILVPLLILLMVRDKREAIADWRKEAKNLLSYGIGYALAYVLTFLVKWLLAMAVSGREAFLEAFSQAVYRMGGQLPAWMEEESFLMRMLGAPIRNLAQIFHMSAETSYLTVIVVLLLVAGILGAAVYLFHGKNSRKNMTILLIMMALIPVLRFLVMSNHSYVHFFFTYRAYITTVMAVLGMLWFRLDLSILRKKR